MAVATKDRTVAGSAKVLEAFERKVEALRCEWHDMANAYSIDEAIWSWGNGGLREAGRAAFEAQRSAFVTAARKQAAADAARIRGMMQGIEWQRRELRQMSERYDLAPGRWQRVDEALGELSCGLTDILADIQP